MRRLRRTWAAVLASAICQAVAIDRATSSSPSVEASSEWVYMESTNTLLVHGANFNQENKLHFNPPLPADKFRQEIISPTQIVLHKTKQESGNYPSVWAFEPGPLKVVASDTGAGVVHLNPEGGGVVVAVVKAEITVHDNESLCIYESTKQVQVTGSGFTDDMRIDAFLQPQGTIFEPEYPPEETIDVSVADVRRDQLTLHLAEGSTWFKDKDREELDKRLSSWQRSSLMVKGLVGKGGRAYYGQVATVLRDPSIDASDTQINRITQLLKITGIGFDGILIPIVDFEPPLDSTNLQIHVVSPKEMWLGLTASQPEWTPAGHFGPLKIKGIDTGAGMVVFESPVTVATVTQANTTVVPAPSVDASSQVIFMTATHRFSVRGAGFNPFNTKLYFDPPLPEVAFDRKIQQLLNRQFQIHQKAFSPNEIRLIKTVIDDQPGKWAFEPGPLKVVGINTGTGLVHINPEEGGVVVAVVQPDIIVQNSKSLLIYQSTKHVEVVGSGFEGLDLEAMAYDRDVLTVTAVRSDRLTLIQADGSTWLKGYVDIKQTEHPPTFPATLRLPVLGPIATVFDDPSVDFSDIEVYRTRTQRLVIRGGGFNQAVRPILDFDPPLDSASLHLNVENRTVMHLGLSKPQPEWTPAGHSGPLKIKGIDTGAGMVVFDSPVTVATVVPDSDAPNESSEKPVQMTPSALPPPSIHTASLVASECGYYQLVVDGEDFNQDYTEIYFEPLLRTDGAWKKVVSSTRMVITVFHGWSLWPSYQRTSQKPPEPNALKIVAIDTGAGLVYLDPEGGGVAVQNDVCITTVQENEGLKIYQSTKQIQLTGACFEDNMTVSFNTNAGFFQLNSTTAGRGSPSDQLTISLPENGSWIQDRSPLPARLSVWEVRRQYYMGCDEDYDGWLDVYVATVLEDPGINASDIKISGTHAHELEITGTGFNRLTRPILDFDPPLDMANIDTDVVNGTMIRLSSLTSSGWTPAEGFQGPLRVKGVDTGAGMVVLDSPVTVATFVAFSNPKHVLLTDVLVASHLVPVMLAASVVLLFLWRYYT